MHHLVVVFDAKRANPDDFDLALLTAMQMNLRPQFDRADGRQLTLDIANSSGSDAMTGQEVRT